MANSPTSKRMTPERWERIKEITADALERDPGGRAAFVARACDDDPEMLQEVLRLLRESASTEEYLAAPLWDVHAIWNQHVEDAPCFAPEQIIADRFQIVRFLDRGGMGEVYSASDLELRELVALKTIRPGIAASQAVIDRFKQEVKQTRQITHPNICRVYDLFGHEQPSGETLWFLTMKLLEGPTLAERLAAGGPLSMKQAVPLIHDMVAALSAAHELGIVHRDFKPNNVMLVGEGSDNQRAVVTDFGLALNIAPDAADGSALAAGGTPAYMAPEQARGDTVGPPADQFALGLVIGEMLTGARPEIDRAVPDECKKRLKTWLRSQAKRRLNPRARRVIARCLEFRPENRFRDVRDIVPILEGQKLGRTRWAIAAGVAAAALAAVVFMVAGVNSGRDRVVEAVQLTPGESLSGSPSLSRDGQWIAYTSDRAEPGNLDVWIQAVRGGPPRRLTTDPAEETEPSISPDGRLVAFRSERNGGGIYVVGADGAGERLLVPGGRSPAFSPDGNSIAYWMGNKDDSTPSGQSYVISLGGGPARRLAGDYADARYPTWNSDGQFLLFEGCRDAGAPLPTCAEWWAVRADGGAPANTGALALLRAENIEIQSPPLKVWRGDQAVFSGRHGASTTIWELTISRKNRHVTGRPRQITSGDIKEMSPSLAATGRMAFGRAFGALHIWRVAAKAGDGTGSAVKLTDDPVSDCCPSASRDGRWLFFSRMTATFRDLFRKNLATGAESVLVSSKEDKFWPTPDATGGRIAFEARYKEESSIGLVSGDRPARKLCTGCSRPTSWFADDKGVFHTTSKGEIAILDVDTGISKVALAGASGIALGEADWSPAHEYLLFTAGRGGTAKQVLAVRFPRATGAPQGPWIPLTPALEEADRPRWSSDGTTFFYLSNRDKFTCIWGQRFDAERGTGVGDPSPVVHYHSQRITPDRASRSVLGMSVAGQSIFINVGEVTETIWTGVLRPPSLLSFPR